MPKRRKLPGTPIAWRDFLKMSLAGRELRVYRQSDTRSGDIIRATIAKCGLLLDGDVYFSLVRGARMHLSGINSGLWLRISDTSFPMPIGNRPRLLDDGRILLMKRRAQIIDILPIGDTLDETEIEE